MIPDWLTELLACPSCLGSLRQHKHGFQCEDCIAEYPIRLGIPDLRMHPDPYISVEDEVAKTTRILAVEDPHYLSLVERYYELSPENPAELHGHYTSAVAAAAIRGRSFLEKLETRYPCAPRHTMLDLGCGTAGMTLAAVDRYDRAVGVDVALRWLVIGARRLQNEGLTPALVCANAEHLPFRSRAFDSVAADSVLEHVRDPRRTVDEVLRVLRSRGTFVFSTNNRYSALPEPHVRIWGFGLLPRRWMPAVALWWRRTPYMARLLSLRELRTLFRGQGHIELPSFDAAELQLPPVRLRIWWMRLRRVRLAHPLLLAVAPMYHIFGRRGNGRDSETQPRRSSTLRAGRGPA